jgi:hypothetical protein
MDRWVNSIRRDVPGCPVPLIEDEVREAAIEFCRRTSIYTYDQTASVTAGDSEVDIVVPDNTSLVAVNYIEVDESREYDLTVEDDTILFSSDAASSFDMTINMALKPEQAATSLPDILFDDYFQGIASGAKAKLMIMPKKEWSDPQLAMVHSGIFDSWVGKATRKSFYANMPQDRRAGRRQWM